MKCEYCGEELGFSKECKNCGAERNRSLEKQQEEEGGEKHLSFWQEWGDTIGMCFWIFVFTGAFISMVGAIIWSEINKEHKSKICNKNCNIKFSKKYHYNENDVLFYKDNNKQCSYQFTTDDNIYICESDPESGATVITPQK